jgi:D-aspartate ligase
VIEADVNGLGVIRSLAAAGVRVWVADADPLAPGLRSRWVERRFVSPALRASPGALVAFLRERVDAPVVLLPTTDHAVHTLTRHASELPRHARVRLPAPDVVEAIVDKRTQYAIAARHGLPMPATWVIDQHHPCDDVAARVPYPCVLKPARSTAFFERFNRKAIRIESPAELCRWHRQLDADGHPTLVQELIPGDVTGLVEITTYLRSDGTLEAAFAARKLEHFPADFGSGTIFESIAVDELLPLTRRVLAAFRFRGLSHVEFKRDARDGAWKFIELNPRTSISSRHPTVCGVNFPWLVYRDALGEPALTSRPAYELGRCWVLPELRALRQRRLRLPVAVSPRSPFHPRHVQGVWSLGDPLPELSFLLRAAVRVRRRAVAGRHVGARMPTSWREPAAR